MRKYHQIEVVNQGDTFDSLVERNFRGKACHRAEDIAPFDVERMAVEMGECLIRSRRDFMVTPSGMGRQPLFTNLLFRTEELVFVHVTHKSGNYGTDRAASENYKMHVTAETPALAMEWLQKMRKAYRQLTDPTGPGFFVMSGGHGHALDRAPLEEKHLLPEALLDLHYGADFSRWAKEFLTGLGNTGISILRGDVGTGKTSFLRHVMCALAATHRFYFVPVDNYHVLTSGSLTEFWKREHREFPGATKVLVLEDAEALLMSRKADDRGAVSTVLNLTDGLMSQFVRVHLICTLNCAVEALDKAVTRPGRLRYFREFNRLPWAQAQAVAAHYQVSLTEERDYSLAEIFGANEPLVNTSGIRKRERKVGFRR